MLVFDEEFIMLLVDGSGFNGVVLVVWLNKFVGVMVSG